MMILPGTLMAQRYLSEVFPNVIVTSNVQYAENISIFPPPTPASIPLLMDIYEPDGDVLQDRPLIIFMHTGSYLPPFIVCPFSLTFSKNNDQTNPLAPEASLNQVSGVIKS